MFKSRLKKPYMAFIAILLPTSGFAAEDLSWIEIVGPSSRELPKVSGADSSVEIRLPVRLNKAANGKLLCVQTRRVIHREKDLDPTVVTLGITPDPSGAWLTITPSQQRFTGSGVYTIHADVWGLEIPAPEPQEIGENNDTDTAKTEAQRPDGPDCSNGSPEDSQALDLKLTKPLAELSTLAKLTLRQTVYVPGRWTAFEPQRLLIAETGGKASIPITTTSQLIDLFDADGNVLSQKVSVTNTITVPPHGQIEASLNLSPAAYWPTNATGNLVLRSPAIETGKVAVAVELITKLSLWWMLFAIAGSVIAGYFGRTRLESYIARKKSEMAAQRFMGSVGDLVRESVDATLCGALNDILEDLQRSLDLAGSASIVDEALTLAKSRRDKAIEAHETRRTWVTEWLAPWQTALQATPSGFATIATSIDKATAGLDKIEHFLDSGDIGAADAAMEVWDDHLGDFKSVWSEALAEFVSDLQGLGKDAGAVDDDAREAIQEKANNLKTQCIGITHHDDAAKIGELLSEINKLAIEFAVDFAIQHCNQVADVATDVLHRLGQHPFIRSKQELDAVETALAAYEKAAESTRPDGIGDLAEAERRLDDSVRALIGPQDTEEIRTELQRRNYLGVLEKMEAVAFTKGGAPVSGFEGIGDAGQRSQILSIVERRPIEITDFLFDAPEPASPQPRLRMAVSGVAIAGQPVGIRAELENLGQEGPSQISLLWSVDGQSAGSTVGPIGELRHTFAGTGWHTVQAETSLPGGRRLENQVRIAVREAPGFEQAASIGRQIERAEALQSLIFGTLITGAGYLIFKDSFTGTAEDFVQVAGWGFFVDVGVAKARELFQPLAGKTIGG